MLAGHAKYNFAGVEICEAEQFGGRIVWHKAEGARRACKLAIYN